MRLASACLPGLSAAADKPDRSYIKLISVSVLRPGMYICDFNAGWMTHPFVANHLRVSHSKQIEEIERHGIRTVFIDTRKGIDVEDAPTLDEVVTTTRHEMLDSADRGASHRTEGKNERELGAHPPSVEEIRRARQVISTATERLKAAMLDARLGKSIDIPALRDSAESISAAVVRNSNAMALVCRLRKRDEYTFSHSLNVSVLLARFSYYLGHAPETTQEIALGGLLHDIGKMTIDADVLNKPGKLSDDEYVHMKSHVSRGIAFIEPFGLPESTLAVVREHHERRDGSGYPMSIEQDAISMEGRMAAIIDVYDAISTERVYHKALPAPEAMRRIFEWQHHFDTALVSSFVRCLGIYPAGSLVRLKSERLAIVLSHDPKSLTQPHLRVVFDIRRNAYVPPEDVDLASRQWADRESIIGHEDARRWAIDISRFTGC